MKSKCRRDLTEVTGKRTAKLHRWIQCSLSLILVQGVKNTQDGPAPAVSQTRDSRPDKVHLCRTSQCAELSHDENYLHEIICKHNMFSYTVFRHNNATSVININGKDVKPRNATPCQSSTLQRSLAL
ncbi:hypothetical protein E2C01_054913 [Portunus trituberculatus]|uniref:Uncharacterized protein n=1 Tax=Portunus trituberculatus TaxID=210409 RepID=A0A5B7GW89_PORTR|nr:hypothetical protein [Portunus trituberculatus]